MSNDQLSLAARSKKFGAAEGEGIVRCDACPVLCRIRPGRAGACARYANENGQLVRIDPVVLHAARRSTRAASWSSSPAANGTARCSIPRAPSSPASAPAPPIPTTSRRPSSSRPSTTGVDTVTVVTEGIFSYCGVKVKIDTDRHLGPETAPIRVEGEQVGHVTTAEYGSQMLSIGGVRHLTGGSKKEGNVTCDTLLELCAGEAVEMTIDGGHDGGRAGRQGADRRRPAGGAHARRLRLGHRRHLRQAMARPCRRGDRGRRPHHRRADRAPGRPRARHAAGRHPRARAQVDAGPLLPGRQSRPRLGRHRHHRSAVDHPEDRSRRWPGPACACC